MVVKKFVRFCLNNFHGEETIGHLTFLCLQGYSISEFLVEASRDNLIISKLPNPIRKIIPSQFCEGLII